MYTRAPQQALCRKSPLYLLLATHCLDEVLKCDNTYDIGCTWLMQHYTTLILMVAPISTSIRSSCSFSRSIISLCVSVVGCAIIVYCYSVDTSSVNVMV